MGDGASGVVRLVELRGSWARLGARYRQRRDSGQLDGLKTRQAPVSYRLLGDAPYALQEKSECCQISGDELLTVAKLRDQLLHS